MSLKLASVTSEGSSARTSFCMLFSDCRLPSTTGTRGRIRNAMLTRLRAHSTSRGGRPEADVEGRLERGAIGVPGRHPGIVAGSALGDGEDLVEDGEAEGRAQ